MVLCLRAHATRARDLGLVPSSCRNSRATEPVLGSPVSTRHIHGSTRIYSQGRYS